MALRPDPGRARQWLADELAHAEYHRQSWHDRVLSWLQQLWHSLTSQASGATGLSLVAGIAVAVILVAIALSVIPRLTRTPAAPDGPLPLGATRSSAAEHRARAEAALRDGDTRTAVIEATRGLARRMVDRGVLEDAPGQTAHEIATALAVAFPEAADRLAAAADAFDAVQYGDRDASASEPELILRLDDELRRTPPAIVPSRAASARTVPR